MKNSLILVNKVENSFLILKLKSSLLDNSWKKHTAQLFADIPKLPTSQTLYGANRLIRYFLCVIGQHIFIGLRGQLQILRVFYWWTNLPEICTSYVLNIGKNIMFL